MTRKSIAATATAFIASLALAFVLTLPVPAANTAPPSPAIWKMEGPNGRVFLFGSFHILPQGMVWRTPALEAAINSAQQFVFELDIDEVKNPLLMMAMTAKFGMLPKGESLHRLLAPERRKQFDDVVTALGLSPARLDRMTPWLAAMTISTRAAFKQSKPGEVPKPGAPRDEEGVWLFDAKGKAQFAGVKTGLLGDLNVEVLEGLKGGEKVITGPFRILRDLKGGEQVREDKTKKKDEKKS